MLPLRLKASILIDLLLQSHDLPDATLTTHLFELDPLSRDLRLPQVLSFKHRLEKPVPNVELKLVSKSDVHGLLLVSRSISMLS
jgi:hypothetical protein